MARPLTGSIRLLPSGRFQASVPEAPGATRRVPATFDTRREADAWVAECVVDLKAGRRPERPEARAPGAVPDEQEAGGRRGPQVTPAGAADLDVLFNAWHQARYVLLGNGNANRGEAVRSNFARYVAPFFAGCGVSDVREITRDHVVALSRWLAGFPVTVTPYQADGCGPTVHLDAPATALEQSTARNVLSVLQAILGEALARGIVAVNVAAGVSACAPNAARQRPHRPRIEGLPLTVVRGLAPHVDVIAQTLLWLYRLLGCRASEAFGPRVRDFEDRGPGRHALLTLREQGGRSFSRYDDDGHVQIQPSSDQLKTTWSQRTLPLPIALSDLLRVLVAAFHTDPVTGEIDLDARLVPGVQQADRSGQARVRTQLERAVAQSAGDLVPAGGTLELKAFRSQVASELDAAGFDQHVRHSYLGHELGPSVQERHYLVVGWQRLVPVAEYYDQLIDHQLGGTLIVPTHHRPQFGRANPISDRLGYVEDVLHEAGWLRTDPAADDLLRVPDIAVELGLAFTTVRRKFATGQLPGRKVQDPSGGQQWAATRADVEAYRDQLASPSTVSRIAEEYQVDYHVALRTLRRACPDIPDASGGRLPITADHEAALRAELERLARLDSRSLRLGAAARLLGMAERSLRRLLADGALDRDEESDGTGTTYVTRSSLARLQAARDGRPTDPGDPDGLSIADLAILADLTSTQVVQLVRTGLLEPSTASARPGVTRASLQRWASGYRPDLLEVLGSGTPSSPA